jgi:universal stress protein E
LERAFALAQNNQATLRIVNVVEQLPTDIPLTNELQEALVNEHRAELDKLIEPFHGRTRFEHDVLVGKQFLQVIHEVLRRNHDLVIKTAESGGLMDRIFGSEDIDLLRECPSAVWLVKPSAPLKYRRILAAVDVGDHYPAEELKSREALNLQILEMALSMAVSEFCELHIAHAWVAYGESTMRGAFMAAPEDKIRAYVEEERGRHHSALDNIMGLLAQRVGSDSIEYINPQLHLEKGWVRKVVPELIKKLQPDLVVMGTVARTGLPGFFIGNTAETIINQLDCSLLAVKPPGFKTPVRL